MRGSTRAQRETDRLLRATIRTLLADPHDWDDYEDQRRWLERLLQRDENSRFTEPEHEAVERIFIARAHLYGEWDGYAVQELAAAASKYLADFSYESEEFVKELQARGITRLRSKDMRWLVGLARDSGVDISPFKPKIKIGHEEDANA